MDASRYIQKVTSDSLIIQDVGKYIGSRVEIIIFPLDVIPEPEQPEPILSAKGFFQKYANPARRAQEKLAWQYAAKEKHATR